jgi:hypothetical protein
MWRTSAGIRKLQGAEARLVRVAATLMFEQLKYWGDSYECGVPEFDELDLEHQRFTVLAVARRLTDDLPPFEPAIWPEATVFALFEYLHGQIAYEIEASQEPDDTPWYYLRRLVRDALLEAPKTGSDEIPAEDSTDLRAWDFAVMYLSDRILLNRDFLDDNFGDWAKDRPDDFFAGPLEWTSDQKRDLLDFYKQGVDEANRLAA